MKDHESFGKAIYLALLHYPVYDREGLIVTTSFTNLDLHDISRVARTYDCKCFFLVTPIRSQREFANRLIRHWIDGFGSSYNPSRREALKVLSIQPGLDESIDLIQKSEGGQSPIIIATGAKGIYANLDFPACRRMINSDNTGKPVLVLFGTGWGLAREVMERADFVLEPIRGRSNYNHLSVRTAVAIVLDRLLGEYGA